MKSKSVCPSCNVVLEFDRAAISVVKCPKCNYRGNVANFREKEPGTEVIENLKLYAPGKLELMESDVEWLQEEKIVELKQGINTLGRMSPNSSATIQLPTKDSFMGKNHARIEVKKKTDGVFDHRLSDNESKNGTFHNNERLETGDVIKLVPGDVIRMGHTVFKFVTG